MRIARIARRRRWILGAAGLAVLLIAQCVLARAGGGGGLGGGGGGGGGVGGGGGGGGGLIFWIVYEWIDFCVEQPFIGLPITAVVIVGVYLSHRSALNAYRGNVIRRGADVMDDNRLAEAHAAISQAVPSFDMAAFSGRVQTAFTKVQAAWCAQDLSTVRPFISDGIHERFSLQIQEQKTLGYRDKMDGVRVISVELAEMTSDGVFDVATVAIEAEAADYRVSMKDSSRISGSTAPQNFVEYWSFLQRQGAKRDASKPGLIEGHCPNCGAELAMNQSAKCQYCGALLRSGTFDWVLAEITQQSEWRIGRRGEVSGADALRRSDPAFNRVDLEDRVSVMFWRKSAADLAGKVDPLRKIATDDFCARYQTSLAAGADGQRQFWGDCAVGSVHLLGVLCGGEMDIGLVEVAWEGERLIARSNAPIAMTGQRMQAHHFFVLSRKPGVSSDPGQSVSSAHCVHCGAPLTSDVSSACPFCGTVQNDGTRGWVLGSIVSPSSDDGRALLAQIQSQAQPSIPAEPAVASVRMSPAGLLGWAIKTAVADGTIDLSERRFLDELALKSGITLERLQQMIDMAQAGTLQIPDPPDQLTARLWLSTIANAAMVDGTLQPQEANLLTATARRFGFSDADVNILLRQAKAQRYASARQELRTARQRGNDGAGANSN